MKSKRERIAARRAKRERLYSETPAASPEVLIIEVESPKVKERSRAKAAPKRMDQDRSEEKRTERDEEQDEKQEEQEKLNEEVI